MRLIGNLLRVYSYIFEAIVSLLALAMSAVIFASPHQTLHPGWLPWPNETLGAWLAGLGVPGLLLVILGKGLLLSGWRFNGIAELKTALWVVGGLLPAFLGSIPYTKSSDPYAKSSERR